MHNQTMQRTGASRLAQKQIQRHRQLAPVADLHVDQNVMMTDAEKESWGQIRARGVWRYCVRHIIWFGLVSSTTAALNLIIDSVFGTRTGSAWLWVPACALTTLVGGPLFGLLRWRKNEKEYANPTLGDPVL